MRERTLNLLFGFAMIGVFGAVTALAQAQDAQQQPGQQQAGQQQAGQQPAGQAGQPKKNWKDQAEYDLFASITKETDNNKKLSLRRSPGIGRPDALRRKRARSYYERRAPRPAVAQVWLQPAAEKL